MSRARAPARNSAKSLSLSALMARMVECADQMVMLRRMAAEMGPRMRDERGLKGTGVDYTGASGEPGTRVTVH